MNKRYVVGLLFNLLLFNNSYADDGLFIGAGAGLVGFDDEVDVVDTGNLYFRLGYSFGEYIDIGADYSFTLLTDDINDVDHDLDIAFAYIKGNIPLSENSKLYLMLGATRVKITEGVRFGSSSFEDDGSGVGIGIQVNSDDESYFTAEYVVYYDDDEFDDVDVDVISGGANFGFITYF